MPSEALAKEGSRKMYYVYLIRSLAVPTQRYVGLSDDLQKRLQQHDAGESVHTAKFRPWELITYVAFGDHSKAREFERYLKHGSGHAFANRHLW